jgi:p-hydroxybenzoate 3-monooxygenase
LHLHGIESVVIENRSREEIEGTIRAGVLEQGTVDLLTESGLGERMKREGMLHHGIELRFGGRGHRLDLSELTGGRAITVYAQHEVIKDLVAARLGAGGEIRFRRRRASPCATSTPTSRGIAFPAEWHRHTSSPAISSPGCDGFHGVCRPAIPARARSRAHARLPVRLARDPREGAAVGEGAASTPYHDPRLRAAVDALARDPAPLHPVQSEGRHRELARRAHLDRAACALATDDGWSLAEGPVLQKGIIAMRSFVVEPMQHGRLFLAGDAAHIVPPTGAKGLNPRGCRRARAHPRTGRVLRFGPDRLLDGYSAKCLRRVWRAEHFSWWMTTMLHHAAGEDTFQQHLQRSQLDYVVSSRAAATSLAENYVGLPFE